MYISALLRTSRTPSKFSSVPILVADELVHPFTCASRSWGNTPLQTETPKSRLIALRLRLSDTRVDYA